MSAGGSSRNGAAANGAAVNGNGHHPMPVSQPAGRELRVATPEAPALAQRVNTLKRLLSFADVLAAVSAAALFAGLDGLTPQGLLAFVAIAAAGWSAIAFVVGLYAVDDLRAWASGATEARRLLAAALLLSWPLHAAAAALGSADAGAVALPTVVATIFLSATGRSLVRAAVHRSAALRQRTLIVGSGVVATTLAEKLRRHQEFGLLPIGLVDDEVHGGGIPGVPVLGGLRDLRRVLDQHGVDRVIIAFSRARHDQLLRCLRTCRDEGVAVDVVPRLFELLQGAPALENVGGFPLVSLSMPQMSPASRLAKRALDIVGAGLALALLAPLFLIIAAAIKLESRGPVFFVQPRMGQGGRIFGLFKFRSMRNGAPLLVNGNGAIVKGHDDPRVTRVGRVIRRFSLDEAPQLLNVLLGHMSLVGPRPLVLPEAAVLTDGLRDRRMALRPGLTGLWQVSGRSSITFEEMIRLDYEYVAGWSLSRDMEILFATLPVVISGRGAC